MYEGEPESASDGYIVAKKGKTFVGFETVALAVICRKKIFRAINLRTLTRVQKIFSNENLQIFITSHDV